VAVKLERIKYSNI